MFLVFVAITLGITYWAAKRTKTRHRLLRRRTRHHRRCRTASRIAGDYMSAASFLGIAALVYFNGFDGLIYSVGWLVGWPIVLFLIAERLRNLGKYTFADVVAFRLQRDADPLMAALSTLVVVIFYLIAPDGRRRPAASQLLFGIEYWQSRSSSSAC